MAITTAMAMSAAPINRAASRPRTVPRYIRETPLASTRTSPTRNRTRKVLAIPIRPLSRNSRRFPWLPTATIRFALRPCASRNAMSSLVPDTFTTL